MPPDRERPLSQPGEGARRELLIWLLFSALVWAIKIAYLAEYVRLPFLRGPVYDSVVYLRQAHAVLAGQHGDPSLLAFSPLYGYFLAATGGVTRALVPILLQGVLGYLNLFILYRVVRSRYGAGAGLVAAALYFGYGLLLFFETKLMSETVGLHLAVLAMAVYLSPRCTAGELRAAIPCGLLVGLSILARASQLFAAPFFVLCAFLPWTADPFAWRRALRRGIGLAIGLTLIFGARALVTFCYSGLVVPVILVSQTVQRTTDPGFGDDFASLSRGKAGVNAWDVVDQAEERLRAARTPSSPSSTDMQHAEKERRPLWGINLGGLLRNAPHKLRHALADTEVTYDYGYFGERSECRALNMLPISFGLLLLAGVLGAVRCVRERGLRSLLPYLPYFLGSLGTMIVFHFSSRYRLFMAVPLALLGGSGLAWLWPRRALSPRARPVAAIALLAVAAAAVWSGARTIRRPLREPEIWELRVAQSALSASDRPELERRLQRAVDLALPGPAGSGVVERAHELARAGGVPVPEPRRSRD